MKHQRKCPNCEALLSPWEIRGAGSFVCPYCATRLEPAESYAYWIGLANVAASTGLLLALGFRGFHLLYAVLLAWLSVQFIAINLLPWVVPPKIEIAKPQKPLRDTLREISGRTELNLRDRKPH